MRHYSRCGGIRHCEETPGGVDQTLPGDSSRKKRGKKMKKRNIGFLMRTFILSEEY